MPGKMDREMKRDLRSMGVRGKKQQQRFQDDLRALSEMSRSDYMKLRNVVSAIADQNDTSKERLDDLSLLAPSSVLRGFNMSARDNSEVNRSVSSRTGNDPKSAASRIKGMMESMNTQTAPMGYSAPSKEK